MMPEIRLQSLKTELLRLRCAASDSQYHAKGATAHALALMGRHMSRRGLIDMEELRCYLDHFRGDPFALSDLRGDFVRGLIQQFDFQEAFPNLFSIDPGNLGENEDV